MTTTIETLSKLHPFKSLSREQLKQLTPHTETISLESNDQIQAQDYINSLVYLTGGKLRFYENISSQYVLSASDDEATNPIFSEDSIDANHYAEVIFSGELLLFRKEKLDEVVFDELFDSPAENAPRDIEINLFNQIEHAIKTNTLELPSLPEIALRVKAAVRKENISAHDIELIIESDPVMALRLIQIANSPIVRGSTKTDNLKDAIVRLGIAKTHDIVLSLAIRNLFKSDSPALNKAMLNLYMHSIEISAISYVIADQFTSFDAGKLLLAGLLHDIGTVPIIAYLEKDLLEVSEEFTSKAELQNTINKLRPAIGSMIISHWKLSEEMLTVVEESENWQRNSGNDTDMTDIINTAHILSYYKNKQMDLLPDISNISGFQKLFPKASCNEDCNDILMQASENINEIKQLLKL